MDPVLLYGLLAAVRRAGLAAPDLPGLLHVLIGRRVTLEDGTLVSGGMTWRQAAEALTVAGWEPPSGPGPSRQRWLAEIRRAGVDSAGARAAAGRVTGRLAGLGYVVGPG
jgi:hypothetical protein